MSVSNVAADWTRYADRLAGQLRDSGDVRDPLWAAAVAQTPRHLLVPSVYAQREDFTTSDTPTSLMDVDGLEQVYSMTTLVTAIDRNEFGAVVPVSSSTKPDLMARMLEALDVHEGHRVLEIGTGTGYNAALLAHRLGDQRVFSVDVDPQLIAVARRRLSSIGRNPTVATADGVDGFPAHAPYDRIIATCGVRQIPQAWHAQLVPGGKVLVDFKPRGGNLVLLQRVDDRRLEGRFAPFYGAFMLMRHLRGPVDDLPSPRWQSELPLERQRTTTTPPELPAVVWFLRGLMSTAGLRRGYEVDQQTRQPIAMTWATSDGSRCVVDLNASGNGERRVREGGPTDLWGGIERAHRQWLAWGEPGWARFGVTVDVSTVENRQPAVWLDQPENIIGIV